MDVQELQSLAMLRNPSCSGHRLDMIEIEYTSVVEVEVIVRVSWKRSLCHMEDLLLLALGLHLRNRTHIGLEMRGLECVVGFDLVDSYDLSVPGSK